MEKHGLLSIIKDYVDIIECQEGTSKTSQKGEGGKEGERKGAREREREGGGRDGRNIHYHAYGGDLFYH